MSDHHQQSVPKERRLSQSGKRSAPGASFKSSTHHLQPTQKLSPPVKTPNGSFHVPALPKQPRTQSQTQELCVAKIAIPRLARDSDSVSAAGSSVIGDKHRVNHACQPCRHRKTKCSGERPMCKHCQDFKIDCIYMDGKRDRVKKEFGTMAGRLGDYERLLRELSHRVDGADQMMIRKALEKEASPEEDEIQSAVSSRKSVNFGPNINDDESHDETVVSAGVGSTGSFDHAEEDFNRTAATRATGYYGKNSEITWMQRLRRQVDVESGDEDEDRQNPDVRSTPGSGRNQYIQGTKKDDEICISDSTYHCDDLSVMVPDQVDPFELPPRHTAHVLFQIYLETVHPAFPIIGKTTFISQYQMFFDNDQSKPGHNWMAILNMIFAIGAKYSHLIQAEWRGDERDHLIYFTRARLLGFNENAILGHADLQRVQIAGLMSFYLSAIDQPNRAWALSGIAIRHGITLGLNLRNENKKVSDSSKEIRYRVWWALCSIERLLAVMNGRPTSFLETDCTTPLPLPVDEEAFLSAGGGGNGVLNNHAIRQLRHLPSQDSSSSTYSSRAKVSPSDSLSPTSQQSGFDWNKTVAPSEGLYFLLYIKLSTITHEVLSSLYRRRISELSSELCETWADVQTTISALGSKLDGWLSDLPTLFDFTKKQQDQSFLRQRINLGFSYYGVRAIINRPCLCRIDRKIPHQSNKSRDFNRSAAAECVHAAKSMMEMLADEPNPRELYKVAPWWCLVHHLMQAATILMLELSFRADHMPCEAEEILLTAKKAIYWLKTMSEESIAASRAWRMCNDILHKVAPRIGGNFDDMPTDVPRSHEFPVFEGQGYSAPGVPHNRDAWAGSPVFQRQFPNHGYFEAPLPGSDSSFQPLMYTPYDEFLSYGQDRSRAVPFSAPDIISAFPSSNQMNTMTPEDPRGQDFLFNRNPQWHPSSGPS